jgi:hypothetical protein
VDALVAARAHVAGLLAATPAPSPTEPGEGLDPNSVSPGLIGFLATFGLVLVSILLFLNLAGRLRRMRYREERDALDARGEEPDGGDDAQARDDLEGRDDIEGQDGGRAPGGGAGP